MNDDKFTVKACGKIDNGYNKAMLHVTRLAMQLDPLLLNCAENIPVTNASLSGVFMIAIVYSNVA